MLWNLEYIVSLVIAVILAMSIHEMAHGLVSYWLGDPTAKLQGRISLNPFAHVDWLGVLCLLLFHFGWAKPVPVDPSYYKDRKTGIIWTSFAGPVANFLLALVCIFCLILILKLNPLFLYSNLGSLLESILSMTATLNIGFGLFNLIPVPPLDGSKVLFAFLPDIQGSPFFMLVLMVLIYLGILSQPLSMMQNGIWNAFVQICSFLLGM